MKSNEEFEEYKKMKNTSNSSIKWLFSTLPITQKYLMQKAEIRQKQELETSIKDVVSTIEKELAEALGKKG